MFEFDVYHMEMLPDGDDYVENNRWWIGRIKVDAETLDDVKPKAIMLALANLRIGALFGQAVFAVNSTDLRRYYVEDLYGSGEWFEVGIKKLHKPLIGLKPLET